MGALRKSPSSVSVQTAENWAQDLTINGVRSAKVIKCLVFYAKLRVLKEIFG